MTTFEDPMFDPRISDWLQADPDHAPGVVLETLAVALPSIPQRHASRVPWRFPTMSMPARVAVAAVLGVLLVGGAFYMFWPSGQATVGGPGPGASASPTPPPSAAESPAQIIPDGTYLGTVQKVDAILERLAGDATLNPEEKDAIIDSVLGIRGATTFQTRIRIFGPSMSVSRVVDGVSYPESWTIRPIDDKRMAAQWSSGTIEFEIRGCGLPGSSCGFTFHAMTPAPSAVEAFVRRLTFEIPGPFVPVS